MSGNTQKITPEQAITAIKKYGGARPAAWQPGDFSLHCLGLSNANKYKRCKHYLDTGEVIWSGR